MHKTLFILILAFIGACDSSRQEGIRGQILLSSAFDFSTSTVSGYNFELEAFTQFPPGPGPAPDIIVDKYTLVNGDILPGLNSPSNNNGFALVSESGSLTESVEFFNAYSEFDTFLPLSPTTDTIKVFQTWVLKTASDNFVKLNVRDIRILNNVAGDYIEVSIDYYYQDDGTPVFSK